MLLINYLLLYGLCYVILGDNGSLYFWDWASAHNFQRLQSAVQPGSIDSEAGILAMTFDKSNSRLITCESDKTIKVYVEDQNAVSRFIFVRLLTFIVIFFIINIIIVNTVIITVISLIILLCYA